MSKETNVVELEEVVEVENEKESNGFLTKVKTVAKKHGKKIVTGIAIGAGILAGYLLGRKAIGDDEVDYIDCEATDTDEFDVHESEE